MGLRAMLDGHHAEPVVTDYTDPEDAAADVLETAFNECAETDRGTVYVEDEDGSLLAFDVEVEMVPSFEATVSDDVQAWRVVNDDGTVHEVEVYCDLGGWFTDATGSVGLATPRAAAQTHAEECHWCVAEILAPGRAARAEVERERDALRAVVAALPICTHCVATATREAPNLGAQYYCDEHAPSQPWTTVDLPYAAEVRAWKWMR